MEFVKPKTTVLHIVVPKGTDRKSWVHGFFMGLQVIRTATGPKVEQREYTLSLHTECCGVKVYKKPEEFPIKDTKCDCDKVSLVEWQEQ